MEIPIYLFTGFLESGKTKFIQETLQDERFYDNENTLLLVCEEGIEEFNPDLFPSDKVYIYSVESKEKLDSNLFSELITKYNPNRILIEYNGMWKLDLLYNSIPENCLIYQQICFMDSTTIMSYNKNMRDLVADKLFNCEMVIFNRLDKTQDIMDFHKLVRNVSRSANISYEYITGEVTIDEIEDPLPFDINANLIEIKDDDYAIWYRDISEEQEKYNNKKIKLKAMVVKNNQLKKNTLAIGRFIMVCCEDDISFGGFIAITDESENFDNKDWVWITATIKVEEHEIYGCEGPVLYINDISFTLPPSQELATFN